MNQKVITIALIVFALIFIVLLAVMMGTVTEKTNTANAQLVDTLAMTEGTDLNSLASSVRGNMVVSTIKNGKSESGSDKLVYIVTTGNSSSNVTKFYGYGESGSGVSVFDKEGNAYSYSTAVSSLSTSTAYTMYGVTDSSMPDYINESTSFDTHVLYTKNGVPIGVHYVQEGIA